MGFPRFLMDFSGFWGLMYGCRDFGFELSGTGMRNPRFKIWVVVKNYGPFYGLGFRV